MKDVFLTSTIHTVAQDIAQKLHLKKDEKILFIDTAAEIEEGDKTWIEEDKQALQKSGFEIFEYTLTNKTKQEVKKQLSEFEYIYVEGGNEVYLLQQAQQSGFLDLMRDTDFVKNKTYIGTSAGSVIAGAEIPQYLRDEHSQIQLESYKGLNFVDCTIFPHWGSPLFREYYREKKIDEAYIAENPLRVSLTDMQYLHITEGNLQLVEVK